MKIAAIIPSRYKSTRFKGKPLVKILGVTMIERVYRQVEKCGKYDDIIVATDDERIKKVVQQFGGNSIITSENHNSGTERLWEVLENSDFDGAVNIQGDEPLIPVDLLSQIFDTLSSGKHPVVTAAYFNESKEEFKSEHVVKLVMDNDFNALYFSRSPIPFINNQEFLGFYHHVGIYGYLKKSISRFIQAGPSNLENMEKLEQLRFLQEGIPIKVILSKEKSHGVDIPDDLTKIENILSERK